MNTLKVVARRKTGDIVRGYLQPSQAPGEYPISLPDTFSLLLEGSSETVVVETASLKAVFFVKRFTGNPEYRETKFFTQPPPSEDIWVRVRFFDNEILEGTIHNGLETFVQPGFLFWPADIASNNAALYVIKSSLVEFNILSVVNIARPRTVPDMESAVAH